MTAPEIDWEKLESIIEVHKNKSWALIPLLQDIQEAFGYVPPASIDIIAAALNMSAAEIQGVITFYAGFSLEPKGKYVIKVCRGTACHVKGSRSILQLMKNELAVSEGETTEDYKFTLETAACLGACALAPAMMVNKTYFGKVSPAKVNTTLAEYGNVGSEEEL